MRKQGLRRIGIGTDRRPATAVNTRFLKADRFTRIAEIGLVIEVDTGDDRAVGIKDVDCIEPATEADFEDCSVPNSK